MRPCAPLIVLPCYPCVSTCPFLLIPSPFLRGTTGGWRTYSFSSNSLVKIHYISPILLFVFTKNIIHRFECIDFTSICLYIIYEYIVMFVCPGILSGRRLGCPLFSGSLVNFGLSDKNKNKNKNKE